MAKSDQLWKHLGIALAAALVFYIVGYSWVEHRRHRLGPWEVTFVKEAASAPFIVINQPGLRITNVEVSFPLAPDLAPTNAALAFAHGREVPFAVPFGECVFMDPTFLPGTITLDLFGHQIEMQPRTLRVDGSEHDWKLEKRIQAGSGS